MSWDQTVRRVVARLEHRGAVAMGAVLCPDGDHGFGRGACPKCGAQV